MGVPTKDTTVAPQPTVTSETHDQIITQAASPPAYINEKVQPIAAEQVPGQARNDDPARQEMAYNADQPPALVTPRTALREDPAWIDCPFCHRRSLTNVKKSETDTTWIYTLLCCICCGCIGAIFPLIFGWGADFDHYCTSCGNRVARVPHEGSSNATVQLFDPQQLQPVASAPVAPEASQLKESQQRFA